MQRFIIICVLIVMYAFLSAEEKEIPERPSNIPADAEGGRTRWRYFESSDLPIIEWYINGNISSLKYVTDDGKYFIEDTFYENGNPEKKIQQYRIDDSKRKGGGSGFGTYLRFAGREPVYHENGKLKEDKCYTLVLKKSNAYENYPCGTEVIYNESGNEVKRTEHNRKCEYGCEEVPRQSVEQLVDKIQKVRKKKLYNTWIKKPVVGKIVSIGDLSDEVEVAYKPGFELSVGDQIFCIIDNEIVVFECGKNLNGIGFFQLIEDHYSRFKSVTKDSDPRFYKKNEIKYTGIVTKKGKHKPGDMITIAGIEFVYIPMDKCPEPVYYNPQKNCTRPQQFWMSRYEITLGEYMKYCFEKNEDFPLNKTAINFKSMQPVDVGDYDENAGGFCYWFGKKHGVNARLPLPDEWEFAARGGNATDPFWGNGNAGDYCWFADNSSGKMHQVGLKKPNPYGLYDIIGNLWEWCEGSNLRGGGYNSYPSEFRYSVIHQLPVQRHDMGTVYDTQGAGFRMIIMVKDY